MLTLLVIAVVGVAFAVFATQNTGTVDIRFGGYLANNIPVYLIVLFPLLLGSLISYVIHLIKNLTGTLNFGAQKAKIKRLKQELAETRKKAHKLELENTRLKAKTGEFDEDYIQ